MRCRGGGGAIFRPGGSTWSNNFPVLSAIQPKSGGGQDGFYAKFTSTGVAKFVSYLGGSGGTVGEPEQVNAIYVSTLGYLLLAGTTSSANFPVTPGAFSKPPSAGRPTASSSVQALTVGLCFHFPPRRFAE